MNRKIFFSIALLIPLLAVAGVLLDQRSSEIPVKSTETRESSNLTSSEKVKRLDDGTKYIVHPDKLRQGCPGKDCIPSIDNPKYEDADEAGWMRPGDEIIGVEGETESLAFPLRILDSHEIVNTKIDGEPIVVTYCPLCRSGLVFSRKVNGDVLEFGVSGKLRNANLVMYDRQTETYWSQIGGKAIIGPRVPQQLELRYSSITNWSSWKKAHPDTKVLSRNTGISPPSSYESRDYLERGYDSPGAFGAKGYSNELDEMELVQGIEVGNSSKAYPADVVEERGVIQDRVGNEPVMIMQRPDDGSIIAFSREVGGKTLNFSLTEKALVDSTGTRWSFSGEELNGSRQLDVITPRGFYWFAWSKFHPETEVYTG
ncbi:MAG: DUF3179 domain-containing protein [Candidatus Nanohaloarchaea archaeon]